MELPDSILVLVPHPDDEVLLTAGLICRAVAEGKQISVALATNGDYLCPDRAKGIARLGESFSVLRRLGVPAGNIYFLGYPDTGYEPEISFLSTLWSCTDSNRVFSSSCGAETYGLPGVREDYALLRTGKHAPYTRSGFEGDLESLLDETGPGLVVTTSRWDKHGDHSALSHFICAALKRRANAALWEGMVHSPAGDLSWPAPGAPDEDFTMPPGLERDTNLRWAERISLPVPEGCHKEELIRMYKTAFNDDEPDVAAYLLAFAKRDEFFWTIML